MQDVTVRGRQWGDPVLPLGHLGILLLELVHLAGNRGLSRSECSCAIISFNPRSGCAIVVEVDNEMSRMSFFEQVYVLVLCIPSGRVASYGQIARLLGQPHAARTVGWALKGLPAGRDVPWHRVVNAAGRVSLLDPEAAAEQRHLLEGEGVVFDPDGVIDLERFGWAGLSEIEVQIMMKTSEVDGEYE